MKSSLPTLLLATTLASSATARLYTHRGVHNSGGSGTSKSERDSKYRKKPKSGKDSKSGKSQKKSDLLYFNRVSTFYVCRQMDETCNIDEETVAEIVVATDDGMIAIYTDAKQKSLGFVDISDAQNPQPGGTVSLPGEPTSVAIKGKHALVVVNMSDDFINTSGQIVVVDIETKTIVPNSEIELGGQPDSIAVSPDKMHAVVAIENERNEDLGDGIIPQPPAGFVVVVNIQSDDPLAWTSYNVTLTGLDGVLEPSDPEPEFVSINEENIAVVTLQENNAVVLLDLSTNTVIDSFTAGKVNLTDVDIFEEDPAIINQSESLLNVPREPDGVTWINEEYFATANEGDMNGGSRGFTVFDKMGNIIYDPGNSAEHLITSIGHYPDSRSKNKGVEFEMVVHGKVDGFDLLFVLSERSSVVLVYDITNPDKTVFVQALPAGVAPEGGVFIEERGVLVIASEKDDRDDKIRASISIYEYGSETSDYPTLMSVQDKSKGSGVPISWGALSGLSASPDDMDTLYSVDDSFYGMSRIFTIDTSSHPAMITDSMYIMDSHDVFADFLEANVGKAKDLINEDGTVNIDSEGIAATRDGFWIVSEGKGNGDDADSLNMLFMTDLHGVIEKVVSLPEDINAIQLGFGFEGVTVQDDFVVVAFQRAWMNETDPRIGLYNPEHETWSFVTYPLDAPESQRGGWVGIADISSLGDGKFLVLERDNQGGPDAAIKKVYSIDLGDLNVIDTMPKFILQGAEGLYAIKDKVFVHDLLVGMRAKGGPALEKVEGLAVQGGRVWIMNDNDGLDDNSGETQLISLII